MLAAPKKANIIDWKLIGSCNLRCAHCYGPPKTERPLPSPRLYQIIDRFAEMEPEWVVLTGGEPLLVPKIDSVMERIRGIGAKIALSTNGSFFGKHQRAIEQHVASLNIPLDGSTPEIHARSRNDTESYRVFFDILGHYQRNPSRKPELLRVGTVYSAATRGDLEPMAERLMPFADTIDRWKIYEMIDYEVERHARQPLIHEQGAFEQETSALLRQLDGSPLAPKIMLSPKGARDQAYFMVNPRGVVVIPTARDGVSYEIPVGHILDDPLSEIMARWSEKVNHGHYHGNHAHYVKSSEPVSLTREGTVVAI